DQWMIDLDLARIEINRALSFTLSQPLFAKASRQGQYIDRPKILAGARNHQIHWTESHLGLQSIERHIPCRRSSTTGASRDPVDCGSVAFLEITQRAIRIRSQQPYDILVE